jgi:hypothetical protein
MNAKAVSIETANGKWSPARIFLTASAIWHLPLGIAGFLYNQSFPIGAAATANSESAYVFGIFETNGWHSLAALVLGVVSAYFAIKNEKVRQVALFIGILHVGIVTSLIVQDPSAFWLASNNADQVVHTSSAAGGIVSGLLTSRVPNESRTKAA